MSTFAIIGAGLSGMACAHALQDAGHSVTLFDKARGPGGRMASRRRQWPLADGLTPPFTFDIGAQFLTARDDAFQAQCAQWAEQGVIAPWGDPDSQSPTTRWVGIPRMSAITRHMADHLNITHDCRISALHRDAEGWHLASDDPEAPQTLEAQVFDHVVLATPAPQSIPLLSAHSPTLTQTLEQVEMLPCWTVYIAFDQLLPLDREWDQPEGDDVIQWWAGEHHKPGRGEPPRLVIQATAQWSQAHLEETPEEIQTQLLAHWQTLMNQPLPAIGLIGAHRWRYAKPQQALEVDWLNDGSLSVCGDACLGGRVESAWCSGHRLGQHLATEPSY